MEQKDKYKLEYAGFWIRFWANLIDAILLSIIFIPILNKFHENFFKSNQNTFSLDITEVMLVWSFYGWQWDSFKPLLSNFLSDWFAPLLVVVLFWIFFSATPGKMLFNIKILDAKTGNKPNKLQFIIRYFGYFISTFFFMLGFIWVAFDKKKQGWHDKIASTVVIRKIKEPVFFENSN